MCFCFKAFRWNFIFFLWNLWTAAAAIYQCILPRLLCVVYCRVSYWAHRKKWKRLRLCEWRKTRKTPEHDGKTALRVVDRIKNLVRNKIRLWLFFKCVSKACKRVKSAFFAAASRVVEDQRNRKQFPLFFMCRASTRLVLGEVTYQMMMLAALNSVDCRCYHRKPYFHLVALSLALGRAGIKTALVFFKIYILFFWENSKATVTPQPGTSNDVNERAHYMCMHNRVKLFMTDNFLGFSLFSINTSTSSAT